MKDKFKNAFNKNKGIKIVLVILFFGILILSVTYAYFDFSDMILSLTKPISASNTSDDQVVFGKTESFSFSPSADNLDEGMGNYTSSASISATLYDYDRSGDAYDTYNVYYYISTNEYVYTTDEEKPELILTITDPSGNEITELNGLIYYTDQNGLNGFDVTGYTGLIVISIDRELLIEGGEEGVLNSLSEEWKFEVSMVNLDSLQAFNVGKTYESEFTLSLEKITLSDQILKENGGVTYIESKGNPDFSSIAETNEGMYAAADDYGTSYYFRGAVDNNWVVFGQEDTDDDGIVDSDIYWRIIRIDGSDNIRLIYSGTTAPTEEDAVTMESDSTQIGTAKYFESTSVDPAYVGYQVEVGVLAGYGTDAQDSLIKADVDKWYSDNILSTSYNSYVADVIYCNNRNLYKTNSLSSTKIVEYSDWSSTYSSSSTYYGSYININSYKPNLVCSSSADQFTVDSENGNGALTYPVALITADEVAFAGGGTISNSDYYLYTNYNYWSLSPYSVSTIHVTIYVILSSDSTNDGALVGSFIAGNFGVRPVLSISSNIFNFSGMGTWDNPYNVYISNDLPQGDLSLLW